MIAFSDEFAACCAVCDSCRVVLLDASAGLIKDAPSTRIASTGTKPTHINRKCFIVFSRIIWFPPLTLFLCSLTRRLWRRRREKVGGRPQTPRQGRSPWTLLPKNPTCAP